MARFSKYLNLDELKSSIPSSTNANDENMNAYNII